MRISLLHVNDRKAIFKNDISLIEISYHEEKSNGFAKI